MVDGTKKKSTRIERAYNAVTIATEDALNAAREAANTAKAIIKAESERRIDTAKTAASNATQSAIETAKPYIDSAAIRAQSAIETAKPYIDSAISGATSTVQSARETAEPYIAKAMEYANSVRDAASKTAASYFSTETDFRNPEIDELNSIKANIIAYCDTSEPTKSLVRELKHLNRQGKDELIKSALNTRDGFSVTLIKTLIQSEIPTDKLEVLIKYGADPAIALEALANKTTLLSDGDVNNLKFLINSIENGKHLELKQETLEKLRYHPEIMEIRNKLGASDEQTKDTRSSAIKVKSENSHSR